MTYSVDDERGILVVTLSGLVTGDELASFSEAWRRDRAYVPSRPALVDASALNPAKLGTDTLRARAAVPRPNPARVAIVAPSDVVFGLARMFQMMTEGRGNHVAVFRGVDEATAWLAAGTA
ncbi:MAG TPA: hypothetical protein VEX86_15985 [Longimicrobium sp.]|nr:hypothetical protein [Longimicrobium sp.]